MSEVEQEMRQLLQEVGKRSAKCCKKSDQVQPNIRCECKHKATYRCRREDMVITVFGRVNYKRSYYICEQCWRGEKPMDKQMKIEAGQMSLGLLPLLDLLGVQTSFDEAAKLPRQFLLLEISDDAIRTATQLIVER